jgi:hypothetical protein
MKDNELRRGNLVTVDPSSNFDEDIIIVESINEEGINLKYDDTIDSICPEFFFEDIYGIPIEEWLIKFGFKRKYDYFFININMHDSLFYDIEKKLIELSITDFASLTMDLSHIKYVHQLENLYYTLTGKELKLNK